MLTAFGRARRPGADDLRTMTERYRRETMRDPAGGVPVRARAGAAGHAVGGAGRGVGRAAARRGAAGPRDRAAGDRAGARGVPAAARGGRAVPRQRRGRSPRPTTSSPCSRRPPRTGRRSAPGARPRRRTRCGWTAVGVDGRGGPVLDALSITIAPGERARAAPGPAVRASRRCSTCCSGWRRPGPGRGDRSTASTSPTSTGTTWLRRVAWVPQRPGAGRRHGRRQHPARGARMPTTAGCSRPPPRPRARRRRCDTGRRATARACPPASSGASRSPGRCWPTGRCSCSTSPPRAWTPTPRPPSWRRCPRRSPGRTAVVVSHRPAVLGAVRPGGRAPGRSCRRRRRCTTRAPAVRAARPSRVPRRHGRLPGRSRRAATAPGGALPARRGPLRTAGGSPSPCLAGSGALGCAVALDGHLGLADLGGGAAARRCSRSSWRSSRCARSGWPRACCGTRSGWRRTTSRCGCWPTCGSGSGPRWSGWARR